jgi:hypothetical protein
VQTIKLQQIERQDLGQLGMAGRQVDDRDHSFASSMSVHVAGLAFCRPYKLQISQAAILDRCN